MGSGADSPCQGEMARRARGGRVGDYEHEVLIRSRPRRRFGDFAAVGKVTRRPQAAKSPCEERNRFIIAPSSAPVCALGHLPPRGKAIVVGRRSEASQKILCQAFFQESGEKSRRSRPVIGTRAPKKRFVVPPNFRAARPLPSAPCCGGESAPVSRPAGSAVLGRARVREALSTQGASLCPAGFRLLMRRRGGEC